MSIRALSFDLDDTLWDCAPAIRHAEATLQEWFTAETPRIVARHDTVSLAAHRAALLAGRPDLACDVTAGRRFAIERLLLEHDYPASRVDEAFAVFHRARSEVVLYDGVTELLTALGERYRLAAITNGNADLGVIGIERHFDVVLAASIDNAPKPAPDMFRDCLSRLGIEPHELLHIGDNAETDVGGAHGAGIRALWFNRRGDTWPDVRPPPEFEVRSIAELGECLLAGRS